MVAAIERGWVQREMEEAAYRHQRAVDAEETIVVGVNRFIGPGKTPLACLIKVSTNRPNGAKSSAYARCALAVIPFAVRLPSTG